MLRCQNRDTSEGLATRRQRSGHSWRPRLRFAVPSTDEAVCFIASFVRSEERAVKLKHMLLSIAAQEPASPSVAISWAATDELVPTVRKTLDAVTAAGLRLRSIEQSVPHTQFEHLRALAQLHASRPPEWVLFSDDDDLWSERRFALYMAEIASAVPSTTCILCRRKAMLQGETTDTNPQDAHAVRKMMADGVVRLTDCNEPDGLDESQHNMAEYFDAAVRYDTLASFVFNMPSKVIGHKLCDLAFGFVTTNCRTCVRFMPRAADEFVYFYNRGNQPGGASTSVTPTNQEAEIARHAVLSAPPPVQALFFGDGSRASPVLHGHARLPSASEGQQCAINFVAGLRMAIEQEMVRLRATGSVVPMALIREACRHQAELIVESKSMDCPALRTIPTLVPWAEALASTSLLSLVVQTFEFEALVDWDTWAVTRVVTERTAIDILRADCQFISPAVGGPGARVGCWFGGGGPPPPKIHLSDDRNLPPLLFKIPQRRRVLTHA